MSLDDQASDHEEWHRELSLRVARERVTPDYEALICKGCQYQAEASGKQCWAYSECLKDYERRTR